jgi:glycosyltransferase involved in cell wall biosynthesis
LGTLCHAEVALLFRALDVGVVCNRDSPFARACHPMKLVEMVACGIPVVAADVGEISSLLSDRADARYVPGNHTMLSDRIRQQLLSPLPLKPQLAVGWLALAENMLDALRSAVRAHEAPSPADS